MFMTFHSEINDCLENMGCTDVEVMEDASPEDDSKGSDWIIQAYANHPNFPDGLMIKVYAYSNGFNHVEDTYTRYDCFYVQPENAEALQTLKESVCITSWEKLREALDSGVLKDSEK